MFNTFLQDPRSFDAFQLDFGCTRSYLVKLQCHIFTVVDRGFKIKILNDRYSRRNTLDSENFFDAKPATAKSTRLPKRTTSYFQTPSAREISQPYQLI